MLGREFVEERMHRALGLSSGDGAQVTLIAEDSALTRFANNLIHQNVAEANATLAIKTAVGNRLGIATTNDLSDEGLKKAADRALIHAQSSQEDPDFPGFPEPETVEPVMAFSHETANCSPEFRAETVRRICTRTAEKQLTAFGAFRSTAAEYAVANSRGVMVYHAGTQASLQATISGDNGSSKSEAADWDIARLDVEMVGDEAISKALDAQNPQVIDPGQYEVVLGPYAVVDILSNLNWTGIGALAVQEGRSWMVGRMGKEVMSPLINIVDDGRDIRGLPLPFDFEGSPRRTVKIVENGVVLGPVYDRRTAAKEGVESTGHAIPPDLAFISGPIALHLFLEAGSTPMKEMIQETERGLFINSFWYTRAVHPRDCVITGMTRDGVWMIEDGKLTYPVKDLRFTQSYVQAMKDVEAVGNEQVLNVYNSRLGFCVPALKIGRFNFTGRTA